MADSGSCDACAAWLRQLVDDVLNSPQSPGLFDFFRGKKRSEDLTVLIINQMLGFIRLVYERSAKQASAVQYLYYWVLEHVLRQLHPMQDAAPGERFRRAVASDPEGALNKLSCPDFHKGLLSVALEVVAAVNALESKRYELFSSTKAAGFQNNMLSVWHGVQWFQSCFAAGRPHAMPPVLLALLQCIKTRCEEELVLAEGSHIYEIMFSGGGSFYSAGDQSLLASFISAVAQLAVERVTSSCQRLTASPPAATSHMQASELATAAAELMDHVLGEHLDLCFGVHLSVICACCTFSIAKAARTPVQFKAILQDLSSASSAGFATLHGLNVSVRNHELELVFKSVCMEVDGQQVSGDIRQFYNRIFLPRVEDAVHNAVKSSKPAPTHLPVDPKSPAVMNATDSCNQASVAGTAAATQRKALQPIAAAHQQSVAKGGGLLTPAAVSGQENTPVKGFVASPAIVKPLPTVNLVSGPERKLDGGQVSKTPLGVVGKSEAFTQTPESNDRSQGLGRLLAFASLPAPQVSPSFRHYR